LKAAKPPAVEIPWENPLIPNKRLRELYTAMAEIRLLEDHLATRNRRKARPSGEEAIRASTALSLLPDDLTSDAIPGIATSFLRGIKLADILSGASDSKKKSKAATAELPLAKESTTRLQLAIGAALALAMKKKGPLVLAYLGPDELSAPQWKPIFRLAAAHSAAVLFVALPGPAKANLKPGKLSELSTSCGVPGIPVDAADAVALYRVVQESMVRVRAGGGPVLMECIPFQLPGKRLPQADPVQNMSDSLLHRKVANEAWFASVASRFTARLKAAAL